MTDRTDETVMTGHPLKSPNPYVYVMIPGASTKHMFLGEIPQRGDLTICGEKILGHFYWSQRATALGKNCYCRECERIWSQSRG